MLKNECEYVGKRGMKKNFFGPLGLIHTHTHTYTHTYIHTYMFYLFVVLCNKQYINYFQITKITKKQKFLTIYG